MGILIHQDKITPEIAEQLIQVCPFGALTYEGGTLSLNAGCKSCKLCVKKSPQGAITWEEENKPTVDKSLWRGVAVYCEIWDGSFHPVVPELLGKAKELAGVTGHPVYALVIGHGVEAVAEELLHYGADCVYTYDHPELSDFRIGPYTAAFYDFTQKVKPSSVLVGATNLGRSLAPRIAARCKTGLTADCTVLEMKENTDLVQIRPAFGGNIMAQIITPNARPQFCTARYKVFTPAPRTQEALGRVVQMEITPEMLESRTRVVSQTQKPKEMDISEAEVIVACGRAFQKEADLAMAKELCEVLGGQLAGTRPLVEMGLIDAKRQIGLSGRTVKPKLIINLGISGSVQYASGMKGSDLILSINSDPQAPIFDISHVAVVGDVFKVVPQLIEKIRGGESIV